MRPGRNSAATRARSGAMAVSRRLRPAGVIETHFDRRFAGFGAVFTRLPPFQSAHGLRKGRLGDVNGHGQLRRGAPVGEMA